MPVALAPSLPAAARGGVAQQGAAGEAQRRVTGHQLAVRAAALHGGEEEVLGGEGGGEGRCTEDGGVERNEG